jgi:hypothetical protein
MIPATFPDGIERAVQEHRAASMALPDAHAQSQGNFPADFCEPAASPHYQSASNPHPYTHNPAGAPGGLNNSGNLSQYHSQYRQDPASLYPYEQPSAYQKQIQEDRNYALALAYAAPSDDLPRQMRPEPHAVVLLNTLARSRGSRLQRAYILIPPLLNAVLLAGAALSRSLVYAFLCCNRSSISTSDRCCHHFMHICPATVIPTDLNSGKDERVLVDKCLLSSYVGTALECTCYGSNIQQVPLFIYHGSMLYEFS